MENKKSMNKRDGNRSMPSFTAESALEVKSVRYAGISTNDQNASSLVTPSGCCGICYDAWGNYWCCGGWSPWC